MRPLGFGVLDRYIVRELVSPFGLGVTLFTFFLVLDRIYNLTELVITKGVPFHLVLQLLVFMLPSFLAHTLPMALLVAVLLAGGRLAGDLEIVACKAAGVSLLRLFRPAFLAGLAVATSTALLTLVVNPLASKEFQSQLFTILKTRAVTGLKERVFKPTWKEKDRLDFTVAAARALVSLVLRSRAVARDEHLSLSTHTGMFGAWVKGQGDLDECAQNLGRAVDELAT